MATVKLVPKTLPVNETEAGDRVLACLNRAVELTTKDIEDKEPPSGCILIFWREYADGTAEESWISSGVNQIEAVGILSKTIHDIQTFALEGVDEVTGDGDGI